MTLFPSRTAQSKSCCANVRQVPAQVSPRSPSDFAAVPSNRVRRARAPFPCRRRRSALRCGAPARQTSPGTRRLSEVRPTEPLHRRESIDQFVLAYRKAACRCRRRRQCSSASRDIRSVAPPRAAYVFVVQQSSPGQQRHAVALGDFARRVLQPERSHLLRRRTDERDAMLRAGFREIGVLAEESIARMNRFGSRVSGSLEDRGRTRDSSAPRRPGRCSTASSACYTCSEWRSASE